MPEIHDEITIVENVEVMYSTTSFAEEEVGFVGNILLNSVLTGPAPLSLPPYTPLPRDTCVTGPSHRGKKKETNLHQKLMRNF